MHDHGSYTVHVCVMHRYPRLDDQAVFWKVIRTSVNPPVLPLGNNIL